MLRSYILCPLLLLVLSSVVHAQLSSVTGVVNAASTGESLSGVRVELVEAGRETETDADGRFRLERIAPGVYTLRASVPGRASRSLSILVTASTPAHVELELAIAPYELAALNVRHDRTRLVGGRLTTVPGAAHTIRESEIRGTLRMIDDVHGLLRTVPGVNVQEEDGYGLRPNIGMRGTGVERSSKVTIMEDGVPVAPAPYASPAAYGFPVVGRMEAIEVRQGSSQVRHGPWTTGGALNFVTTSIPAGRRLSVDLSGGEFGTRKLRATAGDSYRNVGWVAETYRIETDGFKQLDGGERTGFRLHDYMVKLRAHTSPGTTRYQELELKLSRTDELAHETYLGLTDADFRATPLRRYAGSQHDAIDAGQRRYVLRHFLQAAAHIDVTTTLYRHDFARDWYKLQDVGGRALAAVLAAPEQHAAELAILRGADSEPGALRVRANAREYYARGVQSVLGVQLGGRVRHALELGVRVHEDAEDRFQHDDAYQMQNGRMVLTQPGTAGTQANRVQNARAVAVFVEDRISFGAWTLTPGVRFESIRFARRDYAPGDAARAAPTGVMHNGVDVVIPGIGAVRQLGEQLAAFAGVHKGFGPPGPGADERARAEESVNYEAGLRYRGDWAKLQLIGFYNDYANILGRATLAVGEGGEGELFNGGAVRSRGVELAADADAAALLGIAARLPVRLAWTWTDARFLRSFESEYDAWGSVEPGYRLPYLPEHQLHAQAGYVGSRITARVAATHASAMRTRAGSGPIPAGEGTDAFVVLHGSLEYAVRAGLQIYGGIQNLTDARYVVARRPAGARPGMPRTLHAGLRYELRTTGR